MKTIKPKQSQTNPPAETGVKTCFMTRTPGARADMLRFVIAPDNTVVFDVAEKLPGRGWWLTADRDIVRRAAEKRVFNRAAQTPVRVPADLADLVDRALEERCRNYLALCRKAGLLLFGFEAVKKAVAAGQVAAVFEATDASERGQTKLYRSRDTFPVFTLFTRSRLGHLTGMEQAVHIALLRGGLTEAAVATAHKLDLYRNGYQQKG